MAKKELKSCVVGNVVISGDIVAIIGKVVYQLSSIDLSKALTSAEEYKHSRLYLLVDSKSTALKSQLDKVNNAIADCTNELNASLSLLDSKRTDINKEALKDNVEILKSKKLELTRKQVSILADISLLESVDIPTFPSDDIISECTRLRYFICDTFLNVGKGSFKALVNMLSPVIASAVNCINACDINTTFRNSDYFAIYKRDLNAYMKCINIKFNTNESEALLFALKRWDFTLNEKGLIECKAVPETEFLSMFKGMTLGKMQGVKFGCFE